MITVVGSIQDKFNCLDEIRVPFYHENDRNSYYYNEYCGHLYNLAHIEEHKDFVGLEHFRRTFMKDGFPISASGINDILNDYDIIVKEKHGPFDNHTNLTVLNVASRHLMRYGTEAEYALTLFPELNEQANLNTHYGCNMFIARPGIYKKIVSDAKDYLDVLLKVCRQRSMLAYFTETIVTPYLIDKYCTRPYVCDVWYDKSKPSL